MDAIQTLIANLQQTRGSTQNEPVIAIVDNFVAALNEIEGAIGPGAVSSVTNTDTTLNISPTTGAVIANVAATAMTAALNAFSSSLKGLVPASGGGTTNFLRADGTWSAVPAGASGANPTATAGSTANNGVASTFMRSDASPAIQLGSNSVAGLIQGDGTTVSITAGVMSVPTGSASVQGGVKVDGKSIKAVAGVISSEVPNATLRGYNSQASSASSYTVTFSSFTPAVPVAGDLMIINASGGWLPNVPAGWTLINDSSGSNWEGRTFGKILSAGDISTGSVTFTTSGAFDGFVGAICFQGNTQGICDISALQSSGGGPTYKTTSLGLVGSIVYFASARVNSTVTALIGTQQGSTVNSANATGAIFLSTTAPFFGSENQYTFGATTSGGCCIAVGILGPTS